MQPANAQAEAKFHEERARGIGGSDAAAVLSASPFKTPLELWAEKRGAIVGDIRPRTKRDLTRLTFGNLFENNIAEYYAATTGRKIRRHRAAIFSRTHPFMLTHLDRMVWRRTEENNGFGSPGVLEVKSPSQFSRKDWDENEREAPLHYQIQMQHALHVTGYTWGAFAVLIGKDTLVMFDVERNQAFINKLVNAEANFWKMVQAGDEPEAGPYDKHVLGAMYPLEDHGVMTLPQDALDWDDKRTAAMEGIAKLQKIKDNMENYIRAEMKNNELGFLPDGSGQYKWSTHTRKAYTVEEMEIRQLRRLKGRTASRLR